HDPSMRRAVGIDRPRGGLTLKEGKAGRTLRGKPVPRLEEAVAFCKGKPGLYIELEMKTESREHDEEALQYYCDEEHSRVDKFVPQGSDYVLTSFDKRPLRYLKTNHAAASLVLLKSEGLSEDLMAEPKKLDINRIGCRLEGTTRDMV